VRRPPPDTLDQQLNCHSKLHEVIALIQAVGAGADEALMLDPNGMVATCNATNFFVVRGGELWTSRGLYNLPGITRAVVLETARADGVPAYERDFSLTDVYSADEVFVTGTFGGLTPVREVDGRIIGDGRGVGATTERLTRLYRAAIEADIDAAGEADTRGAS
jgi:branched-chain amino acid aminotransferase